MREACKALNQCLISFARHMYFINSKRCINQTLTNVLVSAPSSHRRSIRLKMTCDLLIFVMSIIVSYGPTKLRRCRQIYLNWCRISIGQTASNLIFGSHITPSDLDICIQLYYFSVGKFVSRTFSRSLNLKTLLMSNWGSGK